MEKTIARIISVIFHPLLAPTYALLLLINLKTNMAFVLPVEHNYITVLLVFLISFVMPSIIIFILYRFGYVKSLQMESRRERVLPLFTVSFFFYGTYYLLKQEPFYALFNIFMLGATLLAILSIFVNYFTKISIHMVAQGGLFGILTGFAIAYNQDYMNLLYLLVFIAGLTGFARLKRNAHTPGQVYGGYVMGVVVMMGLFLLIALK